MRKINYGLYCNIKSEAQNNKLMKINRNKLTFGPSGGIKSDTNNTISIENLNNEESEMLLKEEKKQRQATEATAGHVSKNE